MKQDNVAHQTKSVAQNVAHDFKELGQLAKETATNTALESAVPLAKRAVEYGQKAAATIGQDLHGLGKVTKHLASEAVDSISEHASEYYEKGLKKAKNIEMKVEKNLKANAPWYLLAAGIGLIAGAIVINRRRK